MQNTLDILAVAATACYIFGYYRMPAVYAGLAIQLIYLFMRGAGLGRMPLVGPHDTLFFLSASIMLFVIPVISVMKEKKRLLNTAVGLSVFFMALSFLYKPHNVPLPPVLKTFWFETHVAFSFFSYALFAIGALAGALAFNRRDTELETIQYKSILVGYCFFSISMIFGGIWAYLAWGTYWLWTPKELWTVILWLFYSLYLHTRLRQWWQGGPQAVMAVTGFVIVMFLYLVVSLFMKSSHSF